MNPVKNYKLDTGIKRWLASVVFGVLNIIALVAFVFILRAGLEPLTGHAATGIYKALNFRGTLQNTDGSAVADGSYDMYFAIYDASSGGNCLYVATGTCSSATAKSVGVTSGVFTSMVGDTDNGDNAITLDFNDDEYWLGVKVGTDDELTPRVRIGAAGYAFNADLLDGLNTSSNGGTGQFIPATNVFGNLNITGEPRGTLISDSAFYINPASATSTYSLLGLGVGGVEKFKVDASGNLSASGTIYAGTNLIVSGNTDLGDAISDTITFTGRVDSDILPLTDSAYNLGSFNNAWENIYASGTIYAGNTVVSSTSISMQSGRPYLVSSLADDDTTKLDAPMDIVVQGSYAYIASFSDSAIEIIDISDPSDPRHIGYITDDANKKLANVANIFVQGDYAFVVSSAEDALAIIDISRPADPQYVGDIVDSGSMELEGAYDVFVQGKYAYVASFDDQGVAVLDISDPENIRHASSISHEDGVTELSAPRKIYAQGNYLYVLSGDATEGGIEVLDISDPENIRHVFALSADTGFDAANGFYVTDNYIYVETGARMTIVDISDPENIFVATDGGSKSGALIANPPLYEDQPTDVVVSGDYAYIASLSQYGQIDVYNIASSTNPIYIDGIDIPSFSADAIAVQGRYAYLVSRMYDTLKIFELPGANLPTASIGNLSVSTIDISDDATIANNLYVSGGLNIGPGGFYSAGVSQVFASSSSSTALTVSLRDEKNSGASKILSLQFNGSEKGYFNQQAGYFTSSSIYSGALYAVDNNLYDIGSATSSWRDVYASGTIYAEMDVIVNGQSVCLADGTNCSGGGAGGGSNWSYDTNYGGNVITPSSTISVWLKDSLYVSSTAIISGDTTIYGLLTPSGGISTSTLDDIIIGGTTPAAGTFTNLVVNTNLGIGTASPSSTLEVIGASTGIAEFGTGSATTTFYGNNIVVNGQSVCLADGTNCSSVPTAAGWTDGGEEIYLQTSTDNITIGASGNLAKLTVLGDTDEKQLVIKAHASQNYNIFEVQNSSNEPIAWINPSGGFGASGTSYFEHLYSTDNNTYDLGTYDNAWKDIYSSGTIYSATSTIEQLIVTGGPWVDVRNYESFAAAVSAIGSATTTLLIPEEIILTANITVPTNIGLVLLNPTLIHLGNYNLIINGSFDAPLKHIFDYTGTGKVTLGAGSVKEIYPQWWGATGDGVTDDYEAIYNTIAAATTTVQKVFFPKSGIYLVSQRIDLKDNIWIDAVSNVTIKASAAMDYVLGVPVADYNTQQLRIHNITVNGNNVATNGIYLYKISRQNFAALDGVYVYQAVDDGIRTNACQGASFYNIRSDLNGGNGISSRGDNSSKWYGVLTAYNTLSGFEITKWITGSEFYASGIYIFGITSQENGKHGISVASSTVTRVSIDGGWMEANGEDGVRIESTSKVNVTNSYISGAGTGDYYAVHLTDSAVGAYISGNTFRASDSVTSFEQVKDDGNSKTNVAFSNFDSSGNQISATTTINSGVSLADTSGDVVIGRWPGVAYPARLAIFPKTAGTFTGLALSTNSGTDGTEARIDFQMSGNQTGDSIHGGRIGVVRQGADGTADIYFSVSKNDGGGTLTERMRITNTGNVGIGTASPSSTLEVKGASTGIAEFGTGSATTTFYGNNIVVNGQSVCLADGTNCSSVPSAAGWTDSGAEIYLSTAGDEVTIGGTGSLGKLTINGDADQIQFVIKAHSTQNKNLTEWRNSSNAILGYMSPAGNFGASGTLRVDGTIYPNGGISTSTLDGVVIGGSTPAAGTFTTITGQFSTTTLDNVTIGGSTPATGTFTGLIANETVSLNGIINLGDGGDAIIINSNDWGISSAGLITGASLSSTQLTDGGTISFDWVDEEVADDLTIDGGIILNTSITTSTWDGGTIGLSTPVTSGDFTAIGSNTPGTGAFTTLSANLFTGALATSTWYGNISTSTLDGVVIGGSTPAAGTFTTITGQFSTTTLDNVTIGGSTPATGTFTGLIANETVSLNGIINLGDGGDAIIINSNDWGISSAGLITGASLSSTQLTDGGTISFDWVDEEVADDLTIDGGIILNTSITTSTWDGGTIGLSTPVTSGDFTAIGSNTPGTGAFTTLSANLFTGALATSTWYGNISTSTLDGVTIGGSTPAAGTFTTITGQFSTTTLDNVTIGGSTPATGTFTGLIANETVSLNGIINLGDGGDDIAINSNDWDIASDGTISSVRDIDPVSNDTYDLGSYGTAWQDIYVSGTIYGGAGSYTITDTTSTFSGSVQAEHLGLGGAAADTLTVINNSETYSGTAPNVGGAYNLYGINNSITNNMTADPASTFLTLYGINNVISTSKPMRNLYGAYNSATVNSGGGATTTVGAFNVAQNNSAVGETLYGSYNQAQNDGTIANLAYGMYGEALANLNTLTTGYGVYGIAQEGSGTLVTGYGGYFESKDATTNYGLYAKASGGTTDWAGYFVGNVGTDNDTYDLGAYGNAWKDIYASGTIYSGTDVVVSGQSVCLADGTNCIGGSSGGTNWSYDTNYGSSAITPSSTISVWFKDSLYASSTAIIAGDTTIYGLLTPAGGISTSTWDGGTIGLSTPITSGDFTAIGSNTPGTGVFTTLSANLFTGALATSTWYGNISTSTLDGVTIGGSTPATGTFTGLIVNETTSLNGIVNIGDNGDAVAINSSDWDISTTGAMTGITGITNDGGYTQSGTSANIFTGSVSSTIFSSYGNIYVGRTATTTIKGSTTSTFGAGIKASYLNLTGTSATSTIKKVQATHLYSTAGLTVVGGVVLPNNSITDAMLSDAITISGGTIGPNNISGTLTTTGALTIGDNGDTITIDSSVWDVSAAGVATFHGLSTSTLDGVNVGASTRGTGAFTTFGFNGAGTLGDGGDDIAINSNDWDIASDGTISGASIASTQLTDGGTIAFEWVDAEVANAITISGGTIGSNNISGTLTTTGALTIGDNGDTITIDSSVWDVSAAGVATFHGLSTSTLNGVNIGASTRGTGAFTTFGFNGAGTLGDGGDDIAINSNDWDIASDGTISGVRDIDPVSNDTYDLGSYGTAWQDIYVSGTIYGGAGSYTLRDTTSTFSGSVQAEHLGLGGAAADTLTVINNSETYSGTAPNVGGAYNLYGINNSITNNMTADPASTFLTLYGINNVISTSKPMRNLYGAYNSATVNSGGGATTTYGAFNVAQNNSTVGETLYGSYNQAQNDGTIANLAYGMYGDVLANLNTLTTGYGVYGIAQEGSGTLVTGYGGYFESKDATTNYGMYAKASGGTTDWAGYFEGNVGTDNDAYDLGAYGNAWQDIYASGTIYSGTDVVVNGQSVCLADGTNCSGVPAAAGWTDGGTEIYLTTAGDEVTIGGTGSLGKLTINGDADQIQFVIKAHSTQNKNLTEWQNSSNTILGYMSSAGNFGASGTLRVDGASTFAGTATFTGALVLGDGDDIAINSNDWDIASDGTISGASIASTQLTDGGTIDFDWIDGEVADALTVSGGTIGPNNISGTLTTTGALTIGDNGDTITIDSSVWDVSAAGVATFHGLSTSTLNGVNIGASTRGTGAFTTFGFNGAGTLGDGGDDIAINSNDWDIASDGTISGASIASTQLTDGGTIDFDWIDGEVADALTVSGGTIGSNNISGTLTTTGAFTIGDNGDTITIDSSVWDVSAAGVATFHGLSTTTLDGVNIGASTAGTGKFTTLNTTGNTVLGDGVSDTISFGGLIGTNLLPDANDQRNLGLFGYAWDGVYASGTIYGTDLTLGGSAVVGGMDMDFLNNDAIVKIIGPATYTGGGEPVLISSSTLQRWVTNDSASTTYDIAAIDSSGTIYIGEKATLNNLGTTYLWGDTTYLGNETTDSIYFSGSIGGNMLPSGNGTQDIGAYGNAWQDIYASGTVIADAAKITDLQIGSDSKKIHLFTYGGGEDISSTNALHLNYDNNQDVYIGSGGSSVLYARNGVSVGVGYICADNDNTCAGNGAGSVAAVSFFTGATDVAETFTTLDLTIEAGNVVALDKNNPEHILKTTVASDGNILGVVSTQPGMVLGSYTDEEKAEMGITTSTLANMQPGEINFMGSRRPVALAGRVPVKVSNESGAIEIGDYLTSASLPGYAMKMTEPGITVGRVLSAFDGESATSTVIVMVDTGWYNGNGTATSFGEDSTQLSVLSDESNIGPITTADNDLDLAGHSILNVASLKGMEDLWQIDEAGNFITKGEIVKTIETSAGEKDFYPVYNEDPTIMLSGSGEIINGEARIMFDPALSEIMDPNESLSVTISMTSEGAQGIYVAEKSIADILVKEINSGMGSAKFDYIIIAKRKMNNVAPPPNLPPSTEGGENIATSTSTPETGGFDNSLLADNTTSTQETATSTPESAIGDSTATSTEESILAEGVDIDEQMAELEQQIAELQELINQTETEISETETAIAEDSEPAPSTTEVLSDNIIIEESATSTPDTSITQETSTSTIAGI